MTRPRGSTRGGPDAAPTHPNFQHHFFRNVRLKNSSVMRAFAETLHTSQAREVQNAANQHPHLGRSRVAKPIATFHSEFMHPNVPRFLRERRLMHVFQKHTSTDLHPLFMELRSLEGSDRSPSRRWVGEDRTPGSTRWRPGNLPNR